MENLNKIIYDILTKAEATGELGASSTANQIIEAAKPYYNNNDNRAWIDKKIEALEKEPGVRFPQNYKDILIQ